MGFNTTIVVMNDRLNDIENDPEFGKNLTQAVNMFITEKYITERAGRPFYGVDVRAGGCVNAATVVETHHADDTSIVAVGGNMGEELGVVYEGALPYESDEERNIRILRVLADHLGYHIHKKPGM